MTTYQIIIRKIAVYFSKPIWSFIRNCVFWLFRLNEIDWVKNEMVALRACGLESLMALFTWQEDKAGDWTQWIVTLVENNLTGDCDDAATLAKWWFKQNGVEAEILNLYSAKEGHAICVTKDRTKMVTNERVVELNPATWEDDILRYFGNKYEVII
jgi:hypothetical protein